VIFAVLDLRVAEVVLKRRFKLLSFLQLSLKTTFFGLHFRRRKYYCTFNHFYVIRPNSMKLRCGWVLRCSRSFKVTVFGTNRKLICDFLLVINSNLPPILHRFRDIASQTSKIAIFGYSFSV